LFAPLHSTASAQESAAMTQRSLVTAEYRDEVVAAINARNRLFEQNIVAGNSEKLIDDYFVPDEWMPIVLGPHRPPVRGRAAILEDFSRMGAGLSLLKIESLEVQVGNDLASEFGRVHLTDHNGVTRVGRYTVLWIKTDMGWRAKMDFFSPDAWSD
jgi:ketosteroid isomerase-like protein